MHFDAGVKSALSAKSGKLPENPLRTSNQKWKVESQIHYPLSKKVHFAATTSKQLEVSSKLLSLSLRSHLKVDFWFRDEHALSA